MPLRLVAARFSENTETLCLQSADDVLTLCQHQVIQTHDLKSSPGAQGIFTLLKQWETQIQYMEVCMRRLMRCVSGHAPGLCLRPSLGRCPMLVRPVLTLGPVYRCFFPCPNTCHAHPSPCVSGDGLCSAQMYAGCPDSQYAITPPTPASLCDTWSSTVTHNWSSFDSGRSRP